MPRRVLAGWLALFGSGVLALITSGTISIWLGVIAATSRDKPVADGEWLISALAIVGAWAVLGLVGAVIALVHSRLEPLMTGAVAERSAFTALVESAEISRWRHRRVPVSCIAVDGPTAFALPGRRPRIVVTSGLVGLLDPDEVDAVIGHEFAHLRGHHAAIRRVAQLNKACLPSLAAASEFEQSTRLLIELIADDAAARRGHRAHLRGALERLSSVTGDVGMLLRAQRLG